MAISFERHPGKLGKHPKLAGVDIETTGLKWSDDVLTVAASKRDGEEIVTVSWMITPNTQRQLPLFVECTPVPQFLHELHEFLADCDAMSMHNASFDLGYLLRMGAWPVRHLRGVVVDTLPLARMVGPRERGSSLEALVKEFKIEVPDPEVMADMKKKRKNMLKADPEAVMSYNEQDAVASLFLGERIWADAYAIYGEEKEGLLRTQGDFAALMAEVRLRGKRINPTTIARRLEEVKGETQKLLNEWIYPNKIEGANDREGLLSWLSGKGVEPKLRTPSGAPSLNEESIQDMAGWAGEEVAKVLKAILKVRGLEKERTTWLEPYVGEWADADGFVHPLYGVGGTVSSRLSCSNPNTQAVPYWVPLWDEHLSFDLSQAEFRIAAMYAQEHRIAQGYAMGLDFHDATTELMFGKGWTKDQRTLAKRANFGSIYGGGNKALSDATGVSLKVAGEIRAKHREAYPNLHETLTTVEKRGKQRGYLELWSGKRLYFTKEDVKERAYKFFNQLVQGAVAELMTAAMLELDALGVPIINQVHDSIETPIDVDRATVKRVMGSQLPEWLHDRTRPRIPMIVDVDVKGERYAE